MNRTIVLIALMLTLGACAFGTEEVTAEGYAARAKAMIEDGNSMDAIKLLRTAVYKYPDSYELRFYMGKALLKTSRKFIPGDDGLYLARYYFKKAKSLAPDADSARKSNNEYRYALELQRSAGW